MLEDLESLKHRFAITMMSPAFSFPLTVPEKKYFILSTPRTGSTLLCDLLSNTKHAGAPFPYYRELYKNTWSRTYDRDTTYYDWLLKNRTSPNKYWGCKLHLDDFKQNSSELKQHLFSSNYIIFMRRKDKLDQAISYYIASSTGLFGNILNEDKLTDQQLDNILSSVDFDRQSIENNISNLTEMDNMWESILKHFKLKHIEVWYEDLVADMTGTMRGVFEYLELPTNLPINPTIERQTTKLNQELKRLYLNNVHV